MEYGLDTFLNVSSIFFFWHLDLMIYVKGIEI